MGHKIRIKKKNTKNRVRTWNDLQSRWIGGDETISILIGFHVKFIVLYQWRLRRWDHSSQTKARKKSYWIAFNSSSSLTYWFEKIKSYFSYFSESVCIWRWTVKVQIRSSNSKLCDSVIFLSCFSLIVVYCLRMRKCRNSLWKGVGLGKYSMSRFEVMRPASRGKSERKEWEGAKTWHLLYQ
jgi:hypothetical protein